MNTPRTKPLVRHSQTVKYEVKPSPDGQYDSGLWNEEHCQLIGQLVTYFPVIEEQMITFMGLLLGDTKLPTREIFRSIISNEGRVAVLRSLLQDAPINATKGAEYDEIIDRFTTAKNKRNAYVHGLWFTHESGRVFLSEASTDSLSFLAKREVPKQEIEADFVRLTELFTLVHNLAHPERRSPPASRDTQPQPPDAEPPAAPPAGRTNDE